MFARDVFLQMLNGSYVGLGFIVLFTVVCICVINHQIQKTKAKSVCLKSALSASEDFYFKAEKLLDDSATPILLKNHVYDLTLAVTDDRAGKLALDAMFNAIADGGDDRRLRPDNDLIRELENLRLHRIDLFDLFHDAVRASFASIILSHNSKIPGITLTYASQSRTLALASVLEKKLHDWNSKNGDDSHLPHYPLHQPA